MHNLTKLLSFTSTYWCVKQSEHKVYIHLASNYLQSKHSTVLVLSSNFFKACSLPHLMFKVKWQIMLW